MKVEELQNIAFSLGLIIKIQVRETPVSYTHLTLPTTPYV